LWEIKSFSHLLFCGNRLGWFLRKIIKRPLREAKFPNCPWVFFGEDGQRIKDFRGSWETACKEAKLEGRLFHDFRRTAVRNMVRAGVRERVSPRKSKFAKWAQFGHSTGTGSAISLRG
jgi:integrase